MKKFISRRSVLKVGAAGAAAVIAAPTVLRAAKGYPDRPITIVVPFDTGGYNDRLSRAMAPYIQEAIGQPVNIINRAGARTFLGHSYFYQQPDDGYTMLCTSAAPYIPTNVLTQSAPFKVEDFTAINLPSRDYSMISTHAGNSELNSIQDVIKKLKADPGSLTIGIIASSSAFVNLMLFADAQGIPRDKLRLVTYDGGGPVRNATAGAVVDIGVIGGQGSLNIKDQVKSLCLFDNRQRDGWDGVPVTEVNGDDAKYISGSQRGFCIKTSFVEKHPDRFEILVSAMKAATQNPAAVEALKGQQLAYDWYGPEESTNALRSTAEVMAEHIDLLQGN